MKSIYERIDKAVKENGYVPKDFVLKGALKPGEKEPAVLGEMEGIIGHATGSVDKKILDDAIKLIKESLKVNPKMAVHVFDDNKFSFRVPKVKGHLLKEIVEWQGAYDPHKLSTLAYSLAMFGTKYETVKLGLLLMLLFDFSDDEVMKRHLEILGMYEEFTSYVISGVKGWPEDERNQVLLNYAKNLNGYGKINAVLNIEGCSDEIKEWLLCHGCKNIISYGYLGKAVMDKCDFEERLKAGNFSEEEMQGARDIIEAILDERKFAGISTLDSPASLATAYFNELSKHQVTLQDIANLYELKEYLMTKDDKSDKQLIDKAVEYIDRLLEYNSAEDRVKKDLVLDPHTAIRAATSGKLDISGELLLATSKDFDTYYEHCNYFFDNHEYLDDFLNICASNITGRGFPEGMGTELYDSEAMKNCWNMSLVIKNLKNYPGKGNEIIKSAINSPVLIFRRTVATTLKEWESIKGVNLKKISADVYKDVKKIKKKEVDENLKKKWDEILEYK